MSNDSNFPEADDLRKKRKANLRLWKEKLKQGQAQVPNVKDMKCVMQKTGEMIKRHDYTSLEKVNQIQKNFMKPCHGKKLDSISLNVSRVQFGDEHCAAFNALAQSWTPKSATANMSE